ncbi:MAG: YihY/virulence factor BrkB family protein [Deltaproteobacteria bacterium]|nr:YihY/virulence factor BrkB family protein [Deltaproteobacteria bacterium]
MAVFDAVPRIMGFFRTDIWRIRLDKTARWKRFFIRYLRIFLAAFQKFFSDLCPLRASSLTFFSLLSVVPVLAMTFAVAKGFGLQGKLENLIIEQLAGQEEVVTRLVGFSRNLLENTSGGIIAGVGAAFLIWSVISILGSAEDSFNHIWEIRQSRSISRKITDYLAITLISPLLFVMASSVTVLVIAQINELMEAFGLLGYISPLIALVVRIIPYVLIWMLFSFVFIFLPNTQVRFSSGILAGVVAGTVFVLVQAAYIYFQIGVARYNAIYGSFAALPLFLVWLQLSWYIVLFGVEVSYAHQNEKSFEFAPDTRRISRSFKRLLSLQIMHCIVRNFSQGNPPLSGGRISEDLEIPLRLTHDILTELARASLLTVIPLPEHKQNIYQPARSVNEISISFVIESLEKRGEDSIPVVRDESFISISRALTSFIQAMETSPENRLLKDI